MGMGRTQRRTLVALVSGALFLAIWWVAEAVVHLGTGEAVTIAAFLAGLIAAPLGVWTERDRPPRHEPAATAALHAGQHIFLCYSHGDDDVYVARLAAFLRKAGLTVWFDREIISGHR